MILSVAEKANAPQQVITGPALIEEVERTNMIVVREQGPGQGVGVPPRQDPYAMKVDRGRNCYACGGFGHMACYCRNRGQREKVTEERRLEYEGERIKEINEHSDNLKGVENLESLN